MKRTTVEIDEHLLERARSALGKPTAKATIEEALKRVAETAESSRHESAEKQGKFFDRLSSRIDVAVLASDEMWRR